MCSVQSKRIFLELFFKRTFNNELMLLFSPRLGHLGKKMPERKYNPWFQFWAVLWISKDLETRKRARLLAFRKDRQWWNFKRILEVKLTKSFSRSASRPSLSDSEGTNRLVLFLFLSVFFDYCYFSFFFISEAAVRFCPSFLTSVDRNLRFDWKKGEFIP